MRWTLLVLAIAISGPARAQTPSEEEAIKRLAKYGVKVYREKDRTSARVLVANAETLKALDLLRHVKRVDYLDMDITDAKLVKGAVEALKHTLDVKGMRIDAKRGLAEADFEILAKLSKLEGLSLSGNAVTAKQLQVLGGLAKQKGLKSLRIRTAQFPQQELEQLKSAFPEQKFTLYHFPTIHFMDPLPIAPEESRTVKMQKQKLNAAIADIVANLHEYQGFQGENRALDIIRLRNLRDAALDLDDAALRSRLIDDYVFITEKRYKYVKAAGDREPRVSGSALHLFEYEYADAQLTQLRLKMPAESK
jgi:hypothetical protein